MKMSKPIKLPKNIYPYNVEVEYFKEFNRQLQAWIKEVYSGILQVARLDSPADDVNNYMDRALQAWYKISQDMELILGMYFMQVNRIQKKSFERQLNAFARQRNVNIFARDPNLSSSLSVFIRENTLLIKNVGDDVAKKIELAVLEAIQKGTSTEDLRRLIAPDIPSLRTTRVKAGKEFLLTEKEIAKYAKNRASLIAVDQIGKANGQISKMRYQANGLDYYIWQTSGDNRVRPSHIIKDNTKRSWNDSPIPGSEIRCRCTAIPDIDEMIKEYT